MKRSDFLLECSRGIPHFLLKGKIMYTQVKCLGVLHYHIHTYIYTHIYAHQQYSSEKYPIKNLLWRAKAKKGIALFPLTNHNKTFDQVFSSVSYMLHIRSLFMHIRNLFAVSFTSLFTNKKL